MNLELYKKLVSKGGGKYELTFAASGANNVTYENTNSLTATEGIYTVYTSGLYQIDLYGGSGADGSGTESLPCSGGAGGAVYGQINLTAGDVLYYSIGGNGTTTPTAGAGGGANGGGNNGSGGSSVGGGGGYSVVYLLRGLAKDNAGSLTVADLKEAIAQNPDTYIMIAGGGGGGGALFSGSTQTANGGAGGNMSSATGDASDAVAGTWYRGDDGTCTSNLFQNAGTGGSDNSGNWPEGGTGSNSTRHGGGGGGGFAGGSKGSDALILAAGGGAGGSSFIAASVTPLTQANIENTSTTGGSVSISFVKNAAGNDTAEILKEVGFQATISEYFEIVDAQGLTVEGNTVSDANADLGIQSQSVTLTLKARYGETINGETFYGGNNVPVLEDAYVTLKGTKDFTIHFDNTADDWTTYNGEYVKVDQDKKDDPDDTVTNAANVPFKYEVKPKSYSKDEYQGKTVADLWNNPYGTNTFVSATSVAVYSGNKTVGSDEALTPGSYVVVLTVTPKPITGDGGTGIAMVGAQVTQSQFYGTAIVSTSVLTEAEAGKYYLAAEKSLTHNGTSYLLDIQVTARQTEKLPFETYTATLYPDTPGTEYEVPADGWYYIEARGADGGDSGSVTITTTTNAEEDGAPTSRSSESGGTGGNGGYVRGAFWLTKGTKLTIGRSAKGQTSLPKEDSTNSTSAYVVFSDPGSGGECSYVAIGDIPLLIAGGGGGAGRSVTGVIHRWLFGYTMYGKGAAGEPGGSGSNETYNTTYAGSYESYNGTPGDATGGSAAPKASGNQSTATGGQGGLAGSNYLNESATATNLPSYYTERYNEVITDVLADQSYGNVRITPIGYTAEAYESLDKYEDYRPTVTVQVAFSQYFTLQGVTTKDGSSVAYSPVDGKENTYEVTISSYDGGVIGNADAGTVTSSGEFDLIFDLVPKEGFLGGNDVPLVTSAIVSSGDNTMPLTMSLDADDAADYANVAIKANQIGLSGMPTIQITKGESVQKSALYEWDYASLLPTGDDAWMAHFVKLSDVSIVPNDLSPEVTTTYTITAGIEPNAHAGKATVIPSVNGVYATAQTTVEVGYLVTVEGNMSTQFGNEWVVAAGDEIACTLVAPEEYALPEELAVTVDGNQISGYSYSPISGELVIPSGKITGNVVIGGTAVQKKYPLRFFLVDEAGNEYTPDNFPDALKNIELVANAPINDYIAAAKQYEIEQNAGSGKVGHSFQWFNMPESDGEGNYYMPSGGRNIYGKFAPKLYTVTVNYEVPAGVTAPPSKTQEVYFGYGYFIESPEVENCVPNPTFVQGTLDENTAGRNDTDNTVTITVKYTKIPAGLTVRYLFADSGEKVRDDLTITLNQGDRYAIPVENRDGYTPDHQDGFTVTMDSTNVIVYVYYYPNQVKVTFVTEYDEDTDTVKSQLDETRTVLFNQTYYQDVVIGLNSTLPIAVREGYTFLGWYATPDCSGEEITAATKVTMGADHNLYAKWSVNQYTITFDTDGGSAIASIKQDYGTTIPVPTDPTKEGYSFAGWEPQIPETMPGRSITVRAKWNVNPYTITFDTDGGSVVDAITQDYGTTVMAPATPTKEGYTFAGWDTEIPATMPAKNMTIKAKWTVNQYTITFDTDGGSAIASIKQDYGTSVTAPTAPTKEGYTFAGWKPAMPATMPAKNMTIKAQWTINQYTITFDTDGGSTVEAITQDYGTTVTAPAAPTKEGHTFAGWEPAIPSTMPAKNMTIKAKWTVNRYTITFDTDGGSEVAPIKQDYGTSVTAPADPTKEGYTFTGWKPVIPTTMPAQDITIKAQWIINQYTITFDTDGGSAVEAITQDYGTPVTAPAAPTKEGYTFAGWDTEIPATMPAKNMTIKARWNVNSYTVTWIVDGEAITETYEYGATIVKPTDPTKAGYKFTRWDAQIPATMPAEDLSFTAIWSTTINAKVVCGDDDATGTITYIRDGAPETVSSPLALTAEIVGSRKNESMVFAPNIGYEITGVKVIIGGVEQTGITFTANNYTYTFPDDGLTAPTEIIVTTQKIFVTIEIVITGADGQPQIVKVQDGSDVLIAFTPGSGNKFSSVVLEYLEGPDGIPAAKTETLYNNITDGYIFTAKDLNQNVRITINANTKVAYRAVGVVNVGEVWLTYTHNETDVTVKSTDTSVPTAVPLGAQYTIKLTTDTGVEKDKGYVITAINDGGTTSSYNSNSYLTEQKTMDGTYAVTGTATLQKYSVTYDLGDLQDHSAAYNLPQLPANEENAYCKGSMVSVSTMENAASSNGGQPAKFNGWVATYQDGNETKTLTMTGGQFTMPAGDVTLTAQWKYPMEYTVRYYRKNPNTESYVEDTSATEQRSGYVGDVAEISKVYTGHTLVSVTPENGVVPENGEIRVYYDPVEYTVTWNVDGVQTTVTYAYGKNITKPADPEKTGFAFTGWDGYTDGMTMPNNDLTFTAQWAPITLTISQSGMKDGDSAVYEVVQGTDVVARVMLTGNSSVTIQQIPAGTYTVQEVTGKWSWTYSDNPAVKEGTNTSSSSIVVVIGTDTMKTVEFTQIFAGTCWLHSEKRN